MNKLTKKNIIKFRKDLKKGKTLIGGWLQISSSNISEIMGDYQYDWLTIDMEHGSFSVKDLPDIFRSIELKNKLPLVRVPNKNIEITNQVLDAGSAGIIIPNVKNAFELNKIIKSSYLPPKGSRGVGYSRANLFGKNFQNYKNEKVRPIIVAMIENIESVNNLDRILLSEGLDAILIGPYDLSASMKMIGKFNNPKFKSTIDKIRKLSKKYKIPCGIHIIEPNFKLIKKYKKLGYQFLPFSMDTVLLNDALKKSFKY